MAEKGQKGERHTKWFFLCSGHAGEGVDGKRDYFTRTQHPLGKGWGGGRGPHASRTVEGLKRTGQKHRDVLDWSGNM